MIEQERTLEGLGFLGERLDVSGLPYRRHKTWENGFDELRARDFAGIIPMGGNAHAWQEEDHPFMRGERLLLAEAAEEGVPVLGICLGAQLLARSLGAEVRSGSSEIGWLEIAPTEAAADDPLFSGLTAPTGVYQWHYDTFELPAGARLLASSPLCKNQAFRVDGAPVWGIQFHPEVEPDIWEVWIGRHPNEVRESGVDVDALRQSVRDGADASRPFRAGLFDSFFELARESSSSKA